MLPESVLSRAAAEIMDYHGSGQSVMEMSHRSKVFEEIMDEAQNLFRSVLSVPDNYDMLFLQGGASTQFAAIPLNLLNGSGKADYMLTGQFSTKAYKEACKYGDIRVVASSKDKTFSYIPEVTREDFDPEADYAYICLNNTIYGTKFPYIPDTGDVPLVADVSSCFLSEPLDVSKFGIVYGGAQKNLAPAGVAFAIIREDMLDRIVRDPPTMMSFRTHVENNSMFNTPPVFPIYVLKETLKWLKSIGGVDEIYRRNKEKAALLYDEIDRNPLFRGTVEKEDRSLMNICFVMAPEYKELEALINRTLEKLPERRLRIFRMHRFEGKKYAEIASSLSLSVKTVEAEMTKALRTLRDELEIYMKYD